jgi:uncharacterized protein
VIHTRVLRAADRARMPWKNGGGLTSVVAVSALDREGQWDWRISIAHVDDAGPFSYFGGVDRVLTVLTGLLELTDEVGNVSLLAPGEAERFAGEKAIIGRPLGSGVVDLNVMVRRGRFDAMVTRLLRQSALQTAQRGGLAILFAGDEASLMMAGERIDLACHDALLLDDGVRGDVYQISGEDLYQISLTPVDQSTCA